VRSVAVLVSGGVVLVCAAWLAGPVAGYLERNWTGHTMGYIQMAAFLLCLIVGWILALLLVGAGTRGRGLRVGPGWLDRLAGALLGFACAYLLLVTLDVAFALGYGRVMSGELRRAAEPPAVVSRTLVASHLGGGVHHVVVPAVGPIAEPLLPVGMRRAWRP
ncbi:MAG: CvpA family protein, partial [Chloroflexota bacterium]